LGRPLVIFTDIKPMVFTKPMLRYPPQMDIPAKAGDIKFVDVDGDKKLTDADRTFRKPYS
jgi:hypothetical protein